MKFYNSFLIRCWLICEAPAEENQAEERFVFDVEHIQKGEHLRAANPAEALEWMMARLSAERPSNSRLEDEQS